MVTRIDSSERIEDCEKDLPKNKTFQMVSLINLFCC